MSKFIYILFTIIIDLSIYSHFLLNNAYALDTCKGLEIESDPPGILYSNTTKAKFTVNVGNAKALGFGAWKILFDCGTHPEGAADIDITGTKISLERDSSAFACEFSIGSHYIIASSKINGREIDQCTIKYEVADPKNKCKLKLTPEINITSATELIVSGENINPRSTYNPLGYALFLNGKARATNIDNPNSSFFSFKIPPGSLQPGSYALDLRYPSTPIDIFLKYVLSAVPAASFISGTIETSNLVNYYSSPLCGIKFKVGTTDAPGSAYAGTLPPGVIRNISGTPSILQLCDANPKNPGIPTAIGCIHTNPTVFVGDLFKFLMGISGGIAFLMMIMGSFQMITSRGNPQSLQAGRERFTSALIGLLFIIFSVLILQIIGTDVLGIFPK